METPKYTYDNLLWQTIRFMLKDPKELKNYSLPTKKDVLRDFHELYREITQRTIEMRSEGEFEVDVVTYVRMMDGLIEANPSLTNSFIASFMCDYADVSSDGYEDAVRLAENRRQLYYARSAQSVGL